MFILSFVYSILQSLSIFILHIKDSGSFPKPLSKNEERKYLEMWEKGDKSARDYLIEHNLRLVAHIIKKYYSSTNDQEDLISIGTIGLIKAINTFNMHKGIRLSSYASRCVENEILMFFRNGKKTQLDISMNEPIDFDKDGNSLTLMDIIASENNLIYDVDMKINLEKLKDYIKKELSPREQTILKLRYGLDGSIPLPQREVAKILGISRSYVSRIEKKSLETLRKKFNE